MDYYFNTYYLLYSLNNSCPKIVFSPFLEIHRLPKFNQSYFLFDFLHFKLFSFFFTKLMKGIGKSAFQFIIAIIITTIILIIISLVLLNFMHFIIIIAATTTTAIKVVTVLSIYFIQDLLSYYYSLNDLTTNCFNLPTILLTPTVVYTYYIHCRSLYQNIIYSLLINYLPHNFLPRFQRLSACKLR